MLSKLISANKSFLRLFSAIILIIATASCDRKQQSGNNENDNGGNNYPEAVYYNVLDDKTIAALDIIEQIFSNLGDDVQTTFFKNMVILKFKGIDNINDVEKYRKMSLFVTRENAVKLKKDEYFIADLIGLKVQTDEGEALGEVTDVLQTGANDVYEIRTEDGEEILLPAIKDCVKEVDVEGGSMLVHLLPGLRDINRK